MTEVAKDYEHEPDAKVGISVLYLISEVSEDLEQAPMSITMMPRYCFINVSVYYVDYLFYTCKVRNNLPNNEIPPLPQGAP